MSAFIDIIFVIFAAMIFIISGGQIFAQKFSGNSVLIALAGVVSAIATLFLVKDVRDFAFENFAGHGTSVPDPGPRILSASEYYLRGNEKLESGKPQDAMRDFNSAILIKPDFALAILARAKAKAEIGLFDEALQDVALSKEIQPSLIEADDVALKIDDLAREKSLTALWADMEKY